MLAYNPNQPRDPGGEGGGQWVGAGGGDDAAPDGVADPHKPVDPGKESALLTPEEQESITYYQGMIGFSKINNSLRAGNPPGEHAKRLSSAIAKHRLADEATVHRGIGNTLSKKLGDLWRDKEPGDAPITFVDKGFVSTSQSKKIAETYSKNTVTIKLPKGHNALPVVDRDFEHEAEILLDRGTKFKVTNMRETPTGWRRFDVEIMP